MIILITWYFYGRRGVWSFLMGVYLRWTRAPISIVVVITSTVSSFVCVIEVIAAGVVGTAAKNTSHGVDWAE
jgi:hypothetical protein